MFVNFICDKKLISRIYKTYWKLTNKSTIFRKWTDNMNRQNTRENILMVVNTWKCVQHHYSLEKCQIKTQRDFTTDIGMAKIKNKDSIKC